MLDAINISILDGVHSYTFLSTSVLSSCTMHDSNRSDKIHSNRIPTGELPKLLMLDAINISILYGVHSHILKEKYVHICPNFDIISCTMHDSNRSIQK